MSGQQKVQVSAVKRGAEVASARSANNGPAPVLLDTSHCEQVMRLDILIGEWQASDGQSKQFMFNPWANEYRVFHGAKQLSGGQAIEELLAEYNAL